MAVRTEKTKKSSHKMLVAVIILVSLFLFSSCAALILSFGTHEEGNVAVVPIDGIIVTKPGISGTIDSDTVVKWLDDARTNDRIKGVVIEINSPGGSPVASDEIGRAIKKLRAANKTVVAWIREVGASGGYWVASTTDYIVANRMSVTGSIGVTGSYFGFDQFIEEWNISYRRFVSGEMKDVGSPFRPMSDSERAFLQKKLDNIYDIFVTEVANNRNMSVASVKELATGEYYLGFEALDNGLIDKLGGLDEALAFISEKEGIKPETFSYKKKESLLGLFHILGPSRWFGTRQEMMI